MTTSASQPPLAASGARRAPRSWSLDAGVARARRLVAQAAAVAGGRGRRARPRSAGARASRARAGRTTGWMLAPSVVAPARESGGTPSRRPGRDEVRVLLGDADREVAAGLGARATGGRAASRPGSASWRRRRSASARPSGSSSSPQPARTRSAPRRAAATERRPQTAETSSSSATRKEEPQPQAAITFGFSTLKPAPCRPST